MSEQIILREYQKTDHAALQDVIRQTWKYDRFCTPATAAKMAGAYLDSCLADQTFTRVAVVDGVPVGIIMAKDIAHHKCPFSLRVQCLRSIVRLCLSKEGRRVAGSFAGVQKLDEELLAACGKDYQGELAFFALRENCRGKGLGRRLFQSAVDYMRSKGIHEFYLFTDTSCNYPFYEHLGLQRRCEKRQTIDMNGQKGDMTFFVYDCQC